MSDSKKNNGKTPRSEAGVLPAPSLTDDQRQALADLVAYLNAIARADDPTPRRDEWAALVPQVDKKRMNHVFLLNCRSTVDQLSC